MIKECATNPAVKNTPKYLKRKQHFLVSFMMKII
jgi:hypothetical protein